MIEGVAAWSFILKGIVYNDSLLVIAGGLILIASRMKKRENNEFGE